MIEMFAMFASYIKDLLHCDITAVNNKIYIFIQAMEQIPVVYIVRHRTICL